MRFVTSNWYNAAAISEDNDLYLWGDNAYGQLGNGKKGGEYGMEENYEYIPQKTMSDVAKVKIKKGRIIVKDQMDQNGKLEQDVEVKKVQMERI